jgi:hypothetical protein
MTLPQQGGLCPQPHKSPGSSNWSGIPGRAGSVKPRAINTIAEPTTAAINMPRHGKRAGGNIEGGAAWVERLSVCESGREVDAVREDLWELS